MLKKIVLSFFTILSFSIIASPFFVYAEDIWAYTYPSGMQAYIDTDRSSKDTYGCRMFIFVKNVYNNKVYSKIEYTFCYDEGEWRYGYRYGGKGSFNAGGTVYGNAAVLNILDKAREIYK